MTTPRFTLLVPVKDGTGVKTRLAPLEEDVRAGLMVAFAHDALAAACRCPLVEVHLVGDPGTLRPLAVELGLEVVPDEGAGDLNRALRCASDRVRATGRGVAVILADLPCLLTEDLTAALGTALARTGRSFVADADGSGTTLLAAPAGVDLDPHFGRGSADAHAASGAAAIEQPLRSLRRDVDTAADLADAVRLGVGLRTAAALRQAPTR